MPRYFFVVCGPDGESHDDNAGTDFSNEAGAFAYAERIVRELKGAGGYDEPGWALLVKNGNGEEIALLPFSDANLHN